MTFTIGEVFKRRELHARFGGQQQGGISTPAEHPLILLFTGDSGHLYGYKDGPQADGTFWYTGEGQVGDMPMARGNLAIRDHIKNSKELHLFEDVGKGVVRYIGPASYAGHHVEVGPDKNGSARKALVFELALEPASNGSAPGLVEGVPDDGSLWRQSLSALRAAALTPAPAGASPAQRKSNAYHRSSAVRVYVLKRAEGTCEACGNPAPFARANGHPYLEPHHISRRADGGPDHPRWVAAVCPNCHRRVHSGADGAAYNRQIAHAVDAIETALSSPTELR